MIKRKKKNSNPMPDYYPTINELKWCKYCIDNNIRISPMGIKETIGKWRIGISIGPYIKGEKPHIAPNIYDVDTVWPSYYKMCKYYYDKNKK